MEWTLTLKGSQQMTRELRSLAAEFPDAVLQALHAEAELEMTEAKQRTPVRTGNLRASGHVTNLRRSGSDTFAVDLVFGGAAAPYAVYVHEDLEAFHRVGQAKFLESVMLESAPHMARRVFERALREIGAS